MSTIAMRATVMTAWLRTMGPKLINGANQTDVPKKKKKKNNMAAAMLPSWAALTPAATNGGQRFKPVSRPKAAAPVTPLFLLSPMRTSFESAQDEIGRAHV